MPIKLFRTHRKNTLTLIDDLQLCFQSQKSKYHLFERSLMKRLKFFIAWGGKTDLFILSDNELSRVMTKNVKTNGQ